MLPTGSGSLRFMTHGASTVSTDCPPWEELGPAAGSVIEPSWIFGPVIDLLNRFLVLPKFASLYTWRMSQDWKGAPGFGFGLGCIAAALISRIGEPASTASTAAWHWAQFPDESKPTEPKVGLTILPQASYNSDLNIPNQNPTSSSN